MKFINTIRLFVRTKTRELLMAWAKKVYKTRPNKALKDGHTTRYIIGKVKRVPFIGMKILHPVVAGICFTLIGHEHSGDRGYGGGKYADIWCNWCDWVLKVPVDEVYGRKVQGLIGSSATPEEIIETMGEEWKNE